MDSQDNQVLADQLWDCLPDVGSNDVVIPSSLARRIYQFLRTGRYDG